MTAYTSELNHLHDARESVQQRQYRVIVAAKRTAFRAGQPGQAGTGETRYFGPLLASRNFQEMLQGHGELQSMLDKVDKGLHRH